MVERFVTLLVAVLFLLTPCAPVHLSPEGANIPNDIELPIDGPSPMDLEALLSGLAGSFTENLGQLDDPDVIFYAQGDPLSVAFVKGRVQYSYRAPDATFAFTMLLEGGNEVDPVGVRDLDHCSNFFLGADPGGWVSNARNYGEVLYPDVYDGVDLRFYFSDGLLKYDLLVKACVDPDVITVRYEGLDRIKVEPGTGDLLLCYGPISLRDLRPIIIQDGLGEAGCSQGGFRPLDCLSFAFDLPRTCRGDVDLIIDPGLRFSTFIGGQLNDSFNAVAIDDDGNIIVGGYGYSQDYYPKTPGTYGPYNNTTGDEDVILTKFDPTLSQVIFSTYFGGGGNDWVKDIVIGPRGKIYMVGGAGPGIPLTNDAIDKVYAGNEDGLLVVLEEDGSELLYSSYFGGLKYDFVTSIDLMDDGGLLLFGRTNSSDLPTTPGAFCETYVRAHPLENEYLDSMFLMKVNASRDSIDFCTYINGFRRGILESLYGISCIGPDGNIYVAAGTDWEDFPVTVGAYQTQQRGESDGFVMKIDPTGSTLLGSTLLGGSGLDLVKGIAAHPDGRLYLVGASFSSNFPVTSDAFQETANVGGSGFITVMASNLSSVEYSSYFGGFGYTHFNSVVVSAEHERIYVQGGTVAEDIPVTTGCFAPLYGDEGDFFLAVFDIATRDLEYCTYLGGDGVENYSPNGMIVDGQGDIVLVGGTGSGDFPYTSMAYSKTSQGSREAFVSILDPSPLGVPSPPSGIAFDEGNGSVNLSWDPPTYDEGQIIEHRIYKGTSVLDMRPVKRIDLGIVHYLDLDVTNGVDYYYGISAINSAGEGAPSESRSARPFSQPSPPSDLNATTGDGTVTLNWSPPQDTGGLEISGYHIYRGGVGDELEFFTTVGNVTGYIDEDVVRGDEYQYAVSTFTTAGNSTLTPSLLIMAEGSPDPPTSFSLEAADQRVVLRWGAPVNDGGRAIEGYQIHRGTRPGELTFLTEVGPAETEYIDGGLENGRPYYYRMTAVNAHGPGKPTPIILAVPIGLPSAPTDLTVTPSNRTVTLLWSPPVLDGGSSIVGYKVFVGTSRTNLAVFTELGPVVTFIDTGLTNGVTLYYAVSAVNEEGEGELSTIVEVTPLGNPGPPTGLAATNDVQGVLLEWSRPVDKGGATNLAYRIFRGTSPDMLLPLDEVLDSTSYLDGSVDAGEEYHYALRSVNLIGGISALTPVTTITAIQGPGPVTNVSAVRGDGQVFLTWSPPVEDGGSPITGYIVYQGPTEADLEEKARPGDVLSHSDRSLENGRTYFYTIVAVNAIGHGTPSIVVNATPVSAPGAPQRLIQRYTEDGIELEWLPPEGGDFAPVTGYRIYRRTEGASMELLVELGPVLYHTDKGVERGNVYYYSVAAISDVGEGEWTNAVEASTGPSLMWVWVLLALVLLGAAATGIVIIRKRQTKEARRLEALTRSPDGLSAPSNLVEEVYLVYGDGRLIATCSREECKTPDADLTSSMLIAIQGMVHDGLEKGGELESIKSGENIVMMERGVHVNLAVVIYGGPDDELKEELESTVAQIEGTYAGVVEDWTGDRSVFEGVDVILGHLLESTSHLTREDLDAAMARYRVSLLSALDLYRGYVRLKVAAMNGTQESVTDASIAVRYDPAMLRLERVEPDTLVLNGDTVELGNVKAGEKRTVSFLFDPLICQETFIDGTITYHNTQGEVLHTSMKRRQATVVCPIFFTTEHASTATLKRLIDEELDMTDSRVFRYPDGTWPRDVLQAGKHAVGGGKVQLVREYVVSGPPFKSEVWFYAETKVKGYKIVMRLRVFERGRLLEFFAASTSMEPIAGLLAEFRRDLIEVFKKRFAVDDVEEIARDGKERRTLERRELLID